MKNYAITIRETISRTVIVEAEDLTEAVQRTEDAVNDGTICLNCEDCFNREVDAADWSKDGIIPKESNVEYYEHLYKSTCIGYLYRDGSNYKVPNNVIVPGRYTDEQIKTIINCLDDGMYFIPDKVGFPEKKFDTETEDDHPWFELDALDFEDSAEAPQIDKSPEEVVDLFLAAKDHWEE